MTDGVDLQKKGNDFLEFICNDIGSGINSKANFLTALGLSVYTEFLGGLYNRSHEHRTITVENKPIGQTQYNYETGLKKMGTPYENLLNRYGKSIYIRVRCGLVHEYHIKGSVTIWMRKESNSNTAIWVDETTNAINFHVVEYYHVFRKALRKYVDEIKLPGDNLLRDYFLKMWNAETYDTTAVLM